VTIYTLFFLFEQARSHGSCYFHAFRLILPTAEDRVKLSARACDVVKLRGGHARISNALLSKRAAVVHGCTAAVRRRALQWHTFRAGRQSVYFTRSVEVVVRFTGPTIYPRSLSSSRSADPLLQKHLTSRITCWLYTTRTRIECECDRERECTKLAVSVVASILSLPVTRSPRE